MSFNKRKEICSKHLFDGDELNVYEENVINLGAGTPSENLLHDCCEMFKEATRIKMESEAINGSFLFQYGPTVGTIEFRTQLSEFLTKGYHSTVFKEDLVLTGGASSGLHLILTTLVNMNGFVFLDEVTYMIALESISQFSSMKIIPVKLNENGVDVFDLEEKIQNNRVKAGNKMFWGIYYTTPTFHNPTGCVFSQEINEALIRIARKYDLLIVCDDVYNLLTFDDGKPPTRLFAYDSFDHGDFKGHVISNGSFSKILSPGIRIGWIESSPRIVNAFCNAGILKSGGGVNNYSSGILSTLIKLGLADKHLKKCLEAYKSQCKALCETLYYFLPPSVKFNMPKGGYFVWIKLPDYCNGDLLSEHCLKHFKVFVIRGSRFSVENKFRNFIRVTFAFQSPEKLREGGKKLCEGIIDFLTFCESDSNKLS